jgi:hypothetical protein
VLTFASRCLLLAHTKMPAVSKVAVREADDSDDLGDFIVPDDAEIEYKDGRPAKKKSAGKKRKSATKNQKAASEKQKSRQSKSAEGSASSRKSGVNNDRSAPDFTGTKSLEPVNKDKIKATWKLWGKHGVRPDANDLSRADADKLNACITDGTMLHRVAKKDLNGLLNSDNFYQYKKKLYITIPGFKDSDYARAAPQEIRKQLFGQPLRQFSYRQWLAQAILYGHPPLLSIAEIQQAFIDKIRANAEWEAWPTKFGDEFRQRLRRLPDPDDRVVKVEEGEDVATSTERVPKANLNIAIPAEPYVRVPALRSASTASDGMDSDDSSNYDPAATPTRSSAFQDGHGESSPTTTRTRSARKEAINRVYEHSVQEGLSVVVPRRSSNINGARPGNDQTPQQADGRVTNGLIEDVTEEDLESMLEEEQIQRAKERSLHLSTNVDAANFVHGADLVERESQGSSRAAREATIELPFHTKAAPEKSTDADTKSSAKKQKPKKATTATQRAREAVPSVATARSAVETEIDELRTSCAQLRKWSTQMTRIDAIPFEPGTDMEAFQLYNDPQDHFAYLVSIGRECFQDFTPAKAMLKAVNKFEEEASLQIQLNGSLRLHRPAAPRSNTALRRRTTGKELREYVMSRHPDFDPQLGRAPIWRASQKHPQAKPIPSQGKSPNERKRKSPDTNDEHGNTGGREHSSHSAKKAKVKKNSVMTEEEIDSSTVAGTNTVMADAGVTSSTWTASQPKSAKAAVRNNDRRLSQKDTRSRSSQQSPSEKRRSGDVPQADEPAEESFTEPSADGIDPASLQNAEGRYVCQWNGCDLTWKTLQDLFVRSYPFLIKPSSLTLTPDARRAT